MTDAFASKPALTLALCTTQIRCGSGLAREGRNPVHPLPPSDDRSCIRSKLSIAKAGWKLPRLGSPPLPAKDRWPMRVFDCSKGPFNNNNGDSDVLFYPPLRCASVRTSRASRSALIPPDPPIP